MMSYTETIISISETNMNTEKQDQYKPEEPVVSPTPLVPESSSVAVAASESPSPAVVSSPVASSGNYASIMSIEEIPEKRSWLKSYAYLPEYFVMLVMLTTLLFALTNLLNIGLDSIINAEKSTGDGYSPYDFSNFELVSSLSAVIVSLPVFVVLYLRTKATEKVTPGIVTHRWRKAFLGVFIVVQLMTIIGNLSGLVYQIVSRIVDGKDTLSLLTSSTQGDPIWQLMIASTLNVALIGFAVYVIGKEYQRKENS
ncbi:hypothetical protein IPL68_00195 [Candidatus Saccharibacteria bacterium]|nr:MAG: hypothetical protein IPL68_00195 [Candidatus Saccharibacteria bacterium]